jgi:uncharacterized protein
MSLAPDRVLPHPDLDTHQHFAAAAAGRLEVPQCGDCLTFHWYPSRTCPNCGSTNVIWKALSGNGRIFSYTIVGHPLMPWLAERVPYVLGLIELPDAPGVRLVTDVMHIDPADVHVGMPVRATFEQLGESLGLVHFEPADAEKRVDNE